MEHLLYTADRNQGKASTTIGPKALGAPTKSMGLKATTGSVVAGSKRLAASTATALMGSTAAAPKALEGSKATESKGLASVQPPWDPLTMGLRTSRRVLTKGGPIKEDADDGQNGDQSRRPIDQLSRKEELSTKSPRSDEKKSGISHRSSLQPRAQKKEIAESLQMPKDYKAPKLTIAQQNLQASVAAGEKQTYKKMKGSPGKSKYSYKFLSSDVSGVSSRDASTKDKSQSLVIPKGPTFEEHMLEERKRTRKRRIIVIIVVLICILALIGVGAGVGIALKDKKGDKPKPTLSLTTM